MMGFFTHFYKKLHSSLFPVLIILLAFSPLASANSNNLNIKSAELVAMDEHYNLHATLEFGFSKNMEEAVSKGVPVYFLVEFQLSKPRKYWFDDEVVTKSTHVVISYHALSRQYLVQQNNHQSSYATFQEAKEALSKIQDWEVFTQDMIEKGELYKAAMRVRLDQDKLSKALQVDSISSEDWKMVSQRFVWQPQFN